MNDVRMKPMSVEDIRKVRGQTDWDRVRAAPEHEGAAEVDVDWSRVTLVEVPPKKLMSLRLDADVVAFFRQGGPGYQTRMNAVLRAYKDAVERAG